MMNYLVAVDGSESSMDAIEHAVDLITQTGGSLLIVHAVEARVLVDDAESVGAAPTNTEVGERIYTEDITDAEARGKSVLADAEETIEIGDDVDIETTLLYGDPVECISSLLSMALLLVTGRSQDASKVLSGVLQKDSWSVPLCLSLLSNDYPV